MLLRFLLASWQLYTSRKCRCTKQKKGQKNSRRFEGRQAEIILKSIIRDNLERIQRRIRQACQRSDRSASDVRLVAVTKYAEWQWVTALAELHGTLAESRPQQLAERAPQLPAATWHLIGPLQGNKARLAMQYADTIHSVDSLKLLKRLHTIAREQNRFVALLLQVNITGERAKSGFDPEELGAAWPEIQQLIDDGSCVSGLMTMGKQSELAEDSRRIFRQLAELRDELNARQAAVPLIDLSMGMTGDFEVAIEEGATLIRIGRALFDGLRDS